MVQILYFPAQRTHTRNLITSQLLIYRSCNIFLYYVTEVYHTLNYKINVKYIYVGNEVRIRNKIENFISYVLKAVKTDATGGYKLWS